MSVIFILKIILFTIFCFLFSLNTTVAASLFFSPSSGSYNTNQRFSVNIYVSSPHQSINAASGAITFPADKLEVVSLSKTNSIFSLWVSEPSFSNINGVINFEGVILNPGFIGQTGRIMTINFRPKNTGESLINFSSASILANDGAGTNILNNSGRANFVFERELSQVEREIPVLKNEERNIQVPSAPKINSLTHPDYNKWYSVNNVQFSWELSPDILATRTLLSRNSQAIPTVQHSPPIYIRELSGLDDGIWYFSVRLRNNAGWGGVARFRLQIDTTKPDYFNIREIIRQDKTIPKAQFVFDALDEFSGIDFYKIQINNEKPRIWRNDGSNVFQTSVLGPGRHTLIARAVDKAGNLLINSVEFIINPISTPVLKEYPQILSDGERAIIKGKTYPNTQLTFFIQQESGEILYQIIESDEEGEFVFVSDKRLNTGIYKIWARARDKRGAQSELTEKINIVVERSLALKAGEKAIDALAVIIPLIALLLLLALIVLQGWKKVIFLKRKILIETTDAKESLKKAFETLKKEVEKQISKLDGDCDLNEKEKKIFNNLKRALNKSEQIISKEIEDIEKEF